MWVVISAYSFIIQRQTQTRTQMFTANKAAYTRDVIAEAYAFYLRIKYILPNFVTLPYMMRPCL